MSSYFKMNIHCEPPKRIDNELLEEISAENAAPNSCDLQRSRVVSLSRIVIRDQAAGGTQAAGVPRNKRDGRNYSHSFAG